MSAMKLKILLGAGFFITVAIVLLFFGIVKKMRKFATGEEEKEAPNFVLENIKKSLSEKKLIKEELKKSEGMSAAILKNIDIGIGIFDRFKVLKNANPIFFTLFEINKNALNQSITLAKETNKVFYQYIKNLKYNDSLKPVSEKIELAEKILETRYFPVNEKEFGMDGFLVTVTDITDIEKTKKQLELKKRLEVMGEMSAGIAHEFKNSLSTLKGYSQMIEEKSENTYVKKYANKILKEVEDINSIVNSFLLYAKPLHPEITEITANDIKEIIKTNFRKEKRHIKLKTSENFKIKSDPVLLKQCIVNIIKNGFEAIDNKEPQIIVKLKQTETGGKLIFTDNGKGMSENTISKIFIPFFTTKEGGTGLGLALCEKIISELNGKISITSQKNEGTKVTIEL
jgi:signal transduction histidine kinase